MLRSGPAGSISRSTLRLASSPSRRALPAFAAGIIHQRPASRIESINRTAKLALAIHRPLTTSLQRYASTQPGSPFDHIDKKHEKDVARTEIEPHPEEVSSSSSVHGIFHEKGVEEGEKDEDMLAGVWQDLVRRHHQLQLT